MRVSTAAAMTEKEAIVNELHRPARKNFPRRRVVLKGIDDLWQADLLEIQQFANINKGHRYILVVIDCFSKYVWCVPIKNKTAAVVTEAMKSILDDKKKKKKKDVRRPRNLQTDQGTEFYNAKFQALMKAHRINHYSVYSVKKASIVERVIRTLKEKLWRHFSNSGKYVWLDALPSVVAAYNDTVHRTIKMTPNEASLARNEKRLLSTAYNRVKTVDRRRQKFKVGDCVRISKEKGQFDKGHLHNWSTELFTVTEVRLTNPRTYKLKDAAGNPILGGFYEYELQKTLHRDVYLVEKVLKTKGDRVYVKWLGLPKSQNSWIAKRDVLSGAPIKK